MFYLLIRSSECPTCRSVVERVQKNPMMDGLVDDFLVINPSKGRSEEELMLLDAKISIPFGKSLKGEKPSARDSEGDDDEDDDEDDEGDEDEDGAEGGAHPIFPHLVAPTRISEDDIAAFMAVTGVPRGEAVHFLQGARDRNLVPLVERAVSFYFDTH